MSDLIPQPIQNTKSGTSETKRKPGRPPRITEEIRDLAAPAEDILIDSKKEATEEDVAAAFPKPELNFGLGLIKSYEQYYRALDIARTQNEKPKFIELSKEMFKLIMNGGVGEFMIHGDPAVWVFEEGTRDHILKNMARKHDDPPIPKP